MRYGSSLMTFSIQCMKKLLPPLIERVVNMVLKRLFWQLRAWATQAHCVSRGRISFLERLKFKIRMILLKPSETLAAGICYKRMLFSDTEQAGRRIHPS